MAKQFSIPEFYRSPFVTVMKAARRTADVRKRDLSPSVLDLGPIRFKIARHFGFCFGVENAIDIAYRALAENPHRRVFLLSEMIHNLQVNNDLRSRGVRFILAPDGSPLIPFSELRSDDIVIVPAFGTTVELFETLEKLGINPCLYDATCPFVEKVWKRAAQLGERGFTVVIHGKHTHEETRATFSHARLAAPSLVILDMEEATRLASYIRGEISWEHFPRDFTGRSSEGFDPARDLIRIGVVNQTTMLATETQAISDLLRRAMEQRYGAERLSAHFADTRDTLCYATSENQEAVHTLVKSGGDLAIVVGGYNSSNTSHLVELLSQHVPTYYVKDAEEVISRDRIRHLRLAHKEGALAETSPLVTLSARSESGGRRTGERSSQGEVVESEGWLPNRPEPIDILITAGASCPDAVVERVLLRVASLAGVEGHFAEAVKTMLGTTNSSIN